MIVYIIGSLRNPLIPKVANAVQAAGHEAFADWYGAGPEADDKWKEYEIERGKTYLQALNSHGAKAVFAFDKKHLDRADAVILVGPAGKSGHMELGYALGRGKLGYYLLDNPDRWDVMLQFCTMVTEDLDTIIADLDTTKLTISPDKIAKLTADKLKMGLTASDTCSCYLCKEQRINRASMEKAMEGYGFGV